MTVPVITRDINTKTDWRNASVNGWRGYAQPSFGQTYDLGTLSAKLQSALPLPVRMNNATRASLTRYNFRLASSAGLVLIDENLKMPVSLETAVQTAGLYNGDNWQSPSSRVSIVSHFFRRYLQLLLEDSLPLLLTKQIALDLSATNLVVKVSRGQPVALQLRQLDTSMVGSPLIALTQVSSLVEPASANDNDTAEAEQSELYQYFAEHLLEHNLKPVITALAQFCGANRVEVLWDWAIDIMLEKLAQARLPDATRQTLMAILLKDELNPGDRLCVTSTIRDEVSNFMPTFGNPIYLKRKCCQDFKKGSRCHNCPGRR